MVSLVLAAQHAAAQPAAERAAAKRALLEANHGLARRAAAQCAVLLKNDARANPNPNPNPNLTLTLTLTLTRCAVLLKNDAVPRPADAAAGAPSPSPSASPSAAPLLPLRRTDSLALIGSFAEAPRYHGIASRAIVPSSTH